MLALVDATALWQGLPTERVEHALGVLEMGVAQHVHALVAALQAFIAKSFPAATPGGCCAWCSGPCLEGPGLPANGLVAVEVPDDPRADSGSTKHRQSR